jgi:imidazolonepropionase-like amidohydrolase
MSGNGSISVDVQGKTIIPGLISAHRHLGLCQGAIGPKPEHYTRENVRNQLEQYERYGVLSASGAIRMSYTPGGKNNSAGMSNVVISAVLNRKRLMISAAVNNN